MHDIEPFYNWRHIYVVKKMRGHPFIKGIILSLNLPLPFTIIISIRNGMILAAAPLSESIAGQL